MVFLVVGFSPVVANAARRPDITTRGVSFVTDNSATLNGSKESTGNDYEDFSIDIEDLNDNTIYYYRAVARNSEGTAYGRIFSFRTNLRYNNNYNYYNNYQNYYDQSYYPYYDQVNYSNYYNNQFATSPVVTTIGATGISSTGAQLSSLILDSGNNFNSSWFEWGTTPSLGIKTEVVLINTMPAGRHVHSLSGLAPNTTYYFRAVAENSYWRNNGATLSFRTNAGSVAQNTNITYIIEEPAVAPEPAPTTPTTEVKEDTTENKTATLSSLAANAFGAGSFFPTNIIGWLILVILALILILLMRHPQTADDRANKEHL